METKEQKLRKILGKQPFSGSEPPPNLSQEVYRRKLAADIARTKKYINQANSAIETLQKKYGDCPDFYDDERGSAAGGTEPSGKNWAPETLKKVHLLAHYEVYKQMPYQPSKTDSIGIATALTLTSRAVQEQALASEQLELWNDTKKDEIAQLKQILADYKLANNLVKQRVAEHPKIMAEMQNKIDNCTTYEAEIEEKLTQVQELSETVKTREDRLHQHLQRVIMKVYAMMDWENSLLMDEDTFKASLASSVSLIKGLVSNIGENSGGKWTPVVPGTAEERLVEVMVRNDLLILRENNGLEVRLRGYGLP